MTRLTRYARGLLVAIAALALTAGAALAARGLAPVSSLGAQHANSNSGLGSEVTRPDADAPDTDQDADEVETPDVETPAADTNADRPQNHGWFVSEAAKSTTLEGQARGAYIASIAQGTQGKPDAATKGAATAAAAKAKGAAKAAAAKASHTGN